MSIDAVPNIQCSSLESLPPELLNHIFTSLDDASNQSLRLTSRGLKDAAEHVLQRYLTIDLDLSGIYPNLPFHLLRPQKPIKELTINTINPTLRSYEFEIQQHETEGYNPTSEEDQVSLLRDGLAPYKIGTCSILHQTDGLNFPWLFKDCKIVGSLPTDRYLQMNTTEEGTIEHYLITAGDGSGETVCYTGTLSGPNTTLWKLEKTVAAVVATGKRCVWVTRDDKEDAQVQQSSYGTVRAATAVNSDDAKSYVIDYIQLFDPVAVLPGKMTASELTEQYLTFCTEEDFKRSKAGQVLSNYLKGRRKTKYESQKRQEKEMFWATMERVLV